MIKLITGVVVSNKMNKTVVVSVETKYRHHLYRKVITKHNRFKAHNELKDINEGDMVVIQETRPISKEKHFIVREKVPVKGAPVLPGRKLSK